MSKEAYYFSHDANARHDPKILAMRSEYGIQGYGVYWLVVEMLREQDEFKLPKKQYIWNAIAMQMQCKADANIDANYAKSFVSFCIKECDLFEENEEFFWSNSLLKRMDKKNELSEKRRAAAKARWEKPNHTNDSKKDVDAIAMQMDANAMQVDAIKGKEIKKKGNIKDNNIPFDEIIDYLNQRANKKYKASAAKTRTLIQARSKEGFTLDDFKTVIDNKINTWLGGDMDKYLRPETLFGTKFEGYLNESPFKPGPKPPSTKAVDFLEIAEGRIGIE